MWLGFFIHEKDGLKTTSQTQYQPCAARAEEKNHHPPRPPNGIHLRKQAIHLVDGLFLFIKQSN
jgi:hypothetical protein